jgi:hypothetical protein
MDANAKAYGEIAEAAWKEKTRVQDEQPYDKGKKVVGKHG